MSLTRIALLLGVAALPLAAQANAATPRKKAAPRPAAMAVKPIAYTERTLANGLRVYAIRDTSTANVAVHVWYDVGSKDDPKGRSGFAHMFEHLMFKATRNLVPEQFDRLTEDVGGFNNASTNDDYTNYYETVPANHLERLLFAEADRMATLVVEPKVFASERDVVKEELRQRVLAQPYGRLLYLYLPQISYSVHPYARPGIGSLEDLQAASIDDVRAFHATYYRPDNAVLVVAGNFEPKQLDQWVDRYFAPIKRPTTAIPRVTVKEPPRTAAVLRTVYEENVPLPAVVMSFQVPPDRDADNAPLAVLNAILSEGESSRLYESMVYRDQIAVNAGTFLDSKQGTGALAAYAIMAGGKTAEQGEAALKRELARLRDAPVKAAELAKAKNRILTSTLRARETADGKASALAEAIIIDGDPAAADRQLTEVAAVTAADIQRVAKRYLGEQQAAIVRYLPKTAKSPAGDTIGLAPGVQIAALQPPADIQIFTPAPEGERLMPPPPAAPVSAKLAEPTTMTLANGLKVVIVERHQLPLVSAVLAVPGGGAADGAAAGLNALTAELVTKGSKTRSATQIASAVEALGGSIDSNGEWDGSTLSVSVKSDQAGKALAIMADAARKPMFAQAEIDRARSQTIDGIKVELKDPARLASFVAARAVFGNGTYGSMLSGTPTSLKSLTRDQIAAAYVRNWRPDQATLVLTGDLTAAQGKALAQTYFGSWTAPKATPAADSAVIAPPAPRVIVVDLAGTGQAGVVIARTGIARSAPGFHAAQTANAVLGTGFSSRLNQEIRIKRGLAYGAGSSLSGRAGTGPMTAQTQTKNPSAPEVVGLILAEMKRLGSETVPAAELDTRKQVLIGNFGRATETTEGLANTISTYVLNRVPLDELKRYTSAIAGIDPAAVQAAAAKLLDPASASIIVVGDAKQFVEELRKTYPQLELIAADKLNLDTAALK